VIDLGTIAGLLEHAHELHAYCPRCDRWSVLPLAPVGKLDKKALRQ
jgi:non-ribosomal peptide synthetase component E (peptide arylation enzyme)